MSEFKRLLRLWFGLSEPVDRRAYLWSGVGLMALKIAVDAALVRWLTGASIGLWAYLSPVLAHREAMFEGGSDEVIGLWMVVWALPFAWVGLSMSLRRALDAGLPGRLPRGPAPPTWSWTHPTSGRGQGDPYLTAIPLHSLPHQP